MHMALTYKKRTTWFSHFYSTIRPVNCITLDLRCCKWLVSAHPGIAFQGLSVLQLVLCRFAIRHDAFAPDSERNFALLRWRRALRCLCITGSAWRLEVITLSERQLTCAICKPGVKFFQNKNQLEGRWLVHGSIHLAWGWMWGIVACLVYSAKVMDSILRSGLLNELSPAVNWVIR